MYLLDFVNRVRAAQGYGPLDELPAGEAGATPLEVAMGCRLELGLIRFSTPQAAAAVSEATGLPIGVDRETTALPAALDVYAGSLHSRRLVAEIDRRTRAAAAI